MSKKFKIITSIFIIVIMMIMIIQSGTISFAVSTPVTEENLRESLQKFVSSDANEENYNITVSDDSIILSVDNETYTLKYDLSDKTTFSYEIPIEKGMAYEEFEKQTDNLILPMIGYIAVANIQGVELKDATAYFTFSYLGDAIDGSISFDSDNSPIIIDDTMIKDGVTVETTNPNAIYVSEFSEKVMEYVNAVYPESQSFSDSKGINSYTITFERKDTTETSCKLVSTLNVNLDADFSKIKGLVDEMESITDKAEEGANKYLNEIARDEEIMQEALNLIAPTENTQNDKNIEINEIPQTGKTFGNLDFLWVMLFSSVAILVLYTIYNRRIDGNN